MPEAAGRRLRLSNRRLRALLEQAHAQGYPIESMPHVGIRLIAEPRALDGPRLAARLGTTVIGRDIETHDVVASTMDLVAAAAARGAPEGLVVFAEQQTKGRGRQRRKWISTRGAGLYFSVLLRPPAVLVDTPVVTLLGAVAVADTIDETMGLGASIKWPNDVLLEGRKVAGVLVEATNAKGKAPLFVLGIGVNTGLVPPVAGATSLGRELAREIDRTKLARALLRRLDAWYGRLVDGGLSELEEAWRSRSADVGKWLALVCNGRFYEGKVLEVSLSAGIKLRLPNGRHQTFRSQHVVIM